MKPQKKVAEVKDFSAHAGWAVRAYEPTLVQLGCFNLVVFEPFSPLLELCEGSNNV